MVDLWHSADLAACDTLLCAFCKDREDSAGAHRECQERRRSPQQGCRDRTSELRSHDRHSSRIRGLLRARVHRFGIFPTQTRRVVRIRLRGRRSRSLKACRAPCAQISIPTRRGLTACRDCAACSLDRYSEISAGNSPFAQEAFMGFETLTAMPSCGLVAAQFQAEQHAAHHEQLLPGRQSLPSAQGISSSQREGAARSARELARSVSAACRGSDLSTAIRLASFTRKTLGRAIYGACHSRPVDTVGAQVRRTPRAFDEVGASTEPRLRQNSLGRAGVAS